MVSHEWQLTSVGEKCGCPLLSPKDVICEYMKCVLEGKRARVGLTIATVSLSASPPVKTNFYTLTTMP